MAFSAAVPFGASAAQACRTPPGTPPQLVDLAGMLSAERTDTVSRTELGLSSMPIAAVTLITTDSICARIDAAVMPGHAPPTLANFYLYRINASRIAIVPIDSMAHGVFVADTSGRFLAVAGTDITSAPPGSTLHPSDPVGHATWTYAASSTWSSVTASNVADGLKTSRWASGQAVQIGATYFQVDLHAVKELGSLRIDDSQFAGDMPLAGDVLLSTNGVTYSRVAQWTHADIANAVLTVSWEPQNGRYVKIVPTQLPSVSGNWFSIGELALYPSGPMPAWTFDGSSSSDLSSAADGDVHSRWTTGAPVSPGSSYFLVNTHALQAIGALRLDDSQFQGDIPQAGDILLSYDCVTYTLASQWTSSDISLGILAKDWNASLARCVKLVATQTPAVASNWFSIGELILLPTRPR
ncbi:MAG: discoidin domain-containing protein [bacterium]